MFINKIPYSQSSSRYSLIFIILNMLQFVTTTALPIAIHPNRESKHKFVDIKLIKNKINYIVMST